MCFFGRRSRFGKGCGREVRGVGGRGGVWEGGEGCGRERRGVGGKG